MSVQNEVPHSSYFSPPNHWKASAYIGIICSILRLHPINKDDTSLVSPAEPLTCQNLSPFQAYTTAASLFALNTSSRMTGLLFVGIIYAKLRATATAILYNRSCSVIVDKKYYPSLISTRRQSISCTVQGKCVLRPICASVSVCKRDVSR